ncbi:MAG: DUF1972 domain-containing protein [Muribaculaceae bacterium]|nr:DUF1972 domain-containing protein [Muribaculaceae bacterium]
MMKQDAMIHVFIVGSKGIPAQYGGFETFVDNLTARKESKNIKYHVSCMDNEEKCFEYNGADCFNIKLPLKGAPGRILHVAKALRFVEKWKKEHKNEIAIVYILGCRIGPFLISYYRRLHKLCVKIFVNPDGLEWKRDKWNALEKKFLRYCEKCLVTNSDMIICDSIHIEKYIVKTYPSTKGKTTYIAYGADTTRSECSDEKIQDWFREHEIDRQEYYLVVGRFVPENNYETIISEYMKSETDKPLIIISNVENNNFYMKLKEKTHFEQDNRIRFVGTVYDQDLLKKIREEAYAYIHGHEVGGTNPSLLEALASTKLSLLLDVGFNKEVAKDSALYWEKTSNSLSRLINDSEKLSSDFIHQKDDMSYDRIKNEYSWSKVCALYEGLWDRE